MNDLDSTVVRKIGRVVTEPGGEVLEVWQDCDGEKHAFRLEWRPGMGLVTEYETHFVVHAPPATYDPPGDNPVRILAEHREGTWFMNEKTYRMAWMAEREGPSDRTKLAAGLAVLLLGISSCLLTTWALLQATGLMWAIFIILAVAAWLGLELWG